MLNNPVENSNKGEYSNADESKNSGQQSNQIFFAAPVPYVDHYRAADPYMNHFYPPVHGYVYPPTVGYAPYHEQGYYAAPSYHYYDPYVIQAYQDPLIMQEFHEFLTQRQLQEELSDYELDEDPHMIEANIQRNDINPVFPNSDEEPNFLPDSGKMFAPPAIADFKPPPAKDTKK